MVNPPRIRFLPWDRPLLPQAVEMLAGAWQGGKPLDLSTTMVVVPTNQSGRRLREALAEYAAKRAQAVFPPRILTPERLIAAEPAANVASRLESLLAWAEVFRALDLENFRSVFPVEPPERHFAWAWRLAQDFTALQRALAGAGLQLGDVCARAGADFPETERWEQIGELERLHVTELAALGLRDAQRLEIAQAVAPVPASGIKRIIMLATPDPLPLAVLAMEAHGRTVPVEVIVFAPEHEAAGFDGWGRPLSEVWATRELKLAEFEERVRVCADPTTQAERIVATARGYAVPEGVLAIGVAEGAVLPLLESGLRRAGISSFNPTGRHRLGDGLYQLLTALSALAREASFTAVETLARCPDFLTFLQRRCGAAFSAARFLQVLDKLHTRHLPPDLSEARRHAPGSRELGEIEALREMLTTGTFPENTAAALGTIFGGHYFDFARPSDVVAADSAEAWADVMRETGRAARRFVGVTNDQWWEVALRIYGESTRVDEKSAGAIDLQGWLELLWEDAPHLMIAGFNDGAVPDAVVGDPFLPESLRERLGLKTNAARFARDAYLLHALDASRANGGRLELLLGKVSGAGDPLRPSRLLLRCADAELPRRVEFLFGAIESGRVNAPWRRAWKLRPRRVASPERVSVTALRGWLECPFRFYLLRVLKMEAVDPGKSELDELDFGVLCHTALEAMGNEPALRDCTDAKVIREFLLTALDTAAVKTFGAEWTLPLIVQIESARQRLSRAADVQAQIRADGWVICHVEQKFEIGIGGLMVVGKIDRIDRHEGTGAIRVIDYKTSDKPVNPRDVHISNARRNETAPEFAQFLDDDREQVWRDLQLPVYLRALAAEYPGEITSGYFNLPKAATERGLALWEGYTRELAESAWRCAEGIIAAVSAGEFSPPNEKMRPEHDRFAALFHHGVADSVEWEETKL